VARFWGNEAAAGCRHANGADRATVLAVADAAAWATAACDDGAAYTAAVGRYAPNPFGLHDMLGNAAEWTADCANPHYRGAPADGQPWSAGDCDLRMVRGGAWDGGPAEVRSAYRVGSPVVVRVYARGFRVARAE
jgi:formylglycine-generating enzyme required for sulfatase activity